MPKPRTRTRRLIKKAKRTPGKRISVRYVKKGGARQRCSACGTVMGSIRSSGAKNKKAQARIYGGNLCHPCLGQVLKYGARVKSKAIKLEEVPIKYRGLIGKAVEKL